MAFFACGSVEFTIFFHCFGGKAAKTMEINSFFLAAAGAEALAARAAMTA
jgi:hypothetical protein